ncbi:hypothetical protein [Psychromicrobium sp. YIM B11713]|uniref:putative acetyltransferase n=1 Tax=Psychromicrobium sp. YIM B11713 TaxID=3145233 RepID=UPI00374E81D3
MKERLFPKALDPAAESLMRYRINGTRPLTDALGMLLSKDAQSITVETKHSVVVIQCADIVAAKYVPQATPRRRPQPS